MIFSTVLCWTAWGCVRANADRTQTSAIGFVFFYLSFVLALLGTTSLILFGTYELLSKRAEPLFRYVQKSFRDACMIVIIVFTLLYLQGHHVVRLQPLIFFLITCLLLTICMASSWFIGNRLISRE